MCYELFVRRHALSYMNIFQINNLKQFDLTRIVTECQGKKPFWLHPLTCRHALYLKRLPLPVWHDSWLGESCLSRILSHRPKSPQHSLHRSFFFEVIIPNERPDILFDGSRDLVLISCDFGHIRLNPSIHNPTFFT